MVSFPGMKEIIKDKKDIDLNASKECVFEQIEKYGPVSAKAVASALGITEKQVMQRISYMVVKKKINIQKEGPNKRRQYFYDPEFPIIGIPEKETISAEEEDQLFKELNSDKDEFKEKIIVGKGLDTLVNRCHHLVLALEHCSSDTIQDTFNLNEEQARVLMNKVVIV